MLGPLRDRPPCNPGCALCPLSCLSVSCNAGTSGTPSSCCTPPAVENGPLRSLRSLINDARCSIISCRGGNYVISLSIFFAYALESTVVQIGAIERKKDWINFSPWENWNNYARTSVCNSRFQNIFYFFQSFNNISTEFKNNLEREKFRDIEKIKYI